MKWENVDLINGVISIRKTLQRIQCTEPHTSRKTKIIITDPKSSCSIRDIPLPTFLTKMAQKYYSKPEAYILTGCEEHYIEPRLLQYDFKKYIHACGLVGVKYHALRHTFATRCIEFGFDAKTLSEILGHTNVNITLNRYVHSSLDTKRFCMEKLTI